MPHPDDPFAPAVHKAHEWVRAVADGLDTDDHGFAYRALRAWMHTVRDRITVAASAHLTAQLPEILRGTYYEGWVPSHVPVRHNIGDFVAQFSREAGINRDDVGEVAGSITVVLSEMFSPGQLDRVFALLPMHLYAVLCGVSAADFEPVPRDDETQPPDRLTDLDARVRALSDAISALVTGLEQLPTDRDDGTRMASAAQQAHRILLAEGLARVPER
ncbi:DUF2267 domain-containing protein [Nocardia cyriacigeorgica]|uniref:DUF2267 domain-containing protein n=1 Tax=Nocardia cyriacigeorgica TaxID=135487 RepID=A0A6P1D2R8_9NOCA|nr:DUF2267 domain-containing protein [Nocardia cyriacigeorgica]NEW37671.1 DUF2267 domain-containing protein [Nocardia cyriacigeorgica]NEW43263.1 DUF2267 domain-containing protein [Nocardia cyriacigeorgica]NEW48942.1 DUF2267 domain-containing protein [Nocardia cyriacigeorgica]